MPIQPRFLAAAFAAALSLSACPETLPPDDGCDGACPAPRCGDGAVNAEGEECDDGNAVAGDGCEPDCRLTRVARCGDGVVNQPSEECDDGNAVAGDGCEPDCKRTSAGYEVVVCPGDSLPPPSSGATCDTAAGTSGALLIVGTVLTPGRVLRGGEVLVDAQGRIACVACDCGDSKSGAARATCPGAVVSPGLINAHDHLGWSQATPPAASAERYEHRHDWRKGLNGHTRISPGSSGTADQKSWGELRFVIGGATSSISAETGKGFLRNLDDAAAQEGLGQPAAKSDTMPLGDTDGEMLASGCAYPSPPNGAQEALLDAYVPHIAEGIGAEAHNEFVCLSSGAADVVNPNMAMVHGIAILPPEIGLMAVRGSSLIWSPRSNISLYGDTAPVTVYARMGVRIALGTDWVLSGSMNLLRELKCAWDLDQTHLGGFFSAEELWLMVTRNAAEAAAVDDVVGVLEAGKVADVAIFRGGGRVDHRAVIEAEPADVALVLRGGKVLYGDDGLVAALLNGAACDPIDVCGAAKRVCVRGELGKSYQDLKMSAGTAYDLFFCGPPRNEPSCVPARGVSVKGSSIYDGTVSDGDRDGDGVPDASDNCPDVFNPIRPLDAGKQADFDGDGAGDVCDPCPLNAHTTECTPVDPDDPDGDGFKTPVDNCPSVPNPLQEDADGDGKGDACDPCPATPNPGVLECPGTIYDVKKGVLKPGDSLSIEHVIVTGVARSGYFVQVKRGDVGDLGEDDSGIFVYSPGATVRTGDRVTLTAATVDDFWGQIELINASAVVESSGEALPDPVGVAPADVATGGVRARALEAVLVRVDGVSVTDVSPALGAGDKAPSNEFVVDGSLRVNDFFYLVVPFPVVGDGFLSIAGILEFRNNHSKLEPREATDLVEGGGVPRLAGIEPVDPAFVREGAQGPTVPAALTVRLLKAVASETIVPVAASPAGFLEVVGGGVTIPAGATGVVLELKGLAPAASVTLTAELAGVQKTATVRVLGAADVPAQVSLSPATGTLYFGRTTTLTLSVDVPAPVGGTSVAVSSSSTNVAVIPSPVVVPENQLTGSVQVTAGAVAEVVTVTATLGAQSASAQLEVKEMPTGTGLVINEVDYDQPGADTSEFIELFNTSDAAVDLASLDLVLVGKDQREYGRVPLAPAGIVPPQGYVVVATPSFTGLDPSVLRVNFANPQDNVRNSVPNGVALVDKLGARLVDALCYGGSITAATITGLPGTVSLVEGTAKTISDSGAGSLARSPNGIDTNNLATDWKRVAVPTPGAANP